MLPVVREVNIGDITVGGNSEMVLMAGPCVIESEDHCRYMAEKLKSITDELEIPFVFKSSYDKANRSSVSSFRGPGLDEGLQILERIKDDIGVPIISDVHTLLEIITAKKVLDCLQVPAFLSRQTDMLVGAGESGVAVAVKKGQFLSPWDVKPLIEKVESTGNKNVMITERGFTFGYNNLVTDMRAFPIIREMNVPVIFDATHSVQLPGGQGSCSGGMREMVPTLARAATAAGIDGIFLEVHDNPDKAKCDGPNMVPLSELKDLLIQIKKINSAVRTTPK
jgi:2-dehydro-3-deoxyphosphooctonate aldolase (KDO 8-P synthase)